jgi:hypothetical protein
MTSRDLHPTVSGDNGLFYARWRGACALIVCRTERSTSTGTKSRTRLSSNCSYRPRTARTISSSATSGNCWVNRPIKSRSADSSDRDRTDEVLTALDIEPPANLFDAETNPAVTLLRPRICVVRPQESMPPIVRRGDRFRGTGVQMLTSARVELRHGATGARPRQLPADRPVRTGARRPGRAVPGYARDPATGPGRADAGTGRPG